ncbi:MAG: NAD(P)-dependent dehydrogenase (short-subunit alcohol dehydrogenase family) [Crocinitomicaceae bacterium]|jgi:NAD(P)-dependent dehydrogenase (short-subunit alcohol dehydrogenase family)
MNKVAWITGCTRGLGRAMTEGLIENGWTLAGCGRSEKHINELKNQCADQHHFDPVDVTDDDAVAMWVKVALEKTGTPDLLINNAGIINKSAPLWEVPEDEFREIIDINIKGVYHFIRHITPLMIERGSGIIVNLSSGWGQHSSPEVAPYCATKFAIEGLSASLAQELPVGLACVALSPGVINTDMLRKTLKSDAELHQTVDDWKKIAIPFLESLDASHNGESLRIT